MDSNKIMHKNVRDISVANVTVTYHGTPIIDDADLTLNYGNDTTLLFYRVIKVYQSKLND